MTVPPMSVTAAAAPPPARPVSSGRLLAVACAVMAALVVAGCGGGGGGGDGAGSDALTAGAGGSGVDCSLAGQKAALRAELSAGYLWYPYLRDDPSPSDAPTLSRYLKAVVSPGDPARPAEVPADRWSGLQSTDASNRTFREGQSRGYGLSVAGQEVRGTAEPLRVRYVEPMSPAARAGVRRGDTVLRVGDRAATDLTRADDFAWLETPDVGTALDLVLRGIDGTERSVSLASEDFDLRPVSMVTVLASPAGRRVGYLVLKDFIQPPGTAPLADAFATLVAAGSPRELIVDLRYNTGGLVSLAAELASRIAQQVVGEAFTTLRYNDRRPRDFTYRFSAQPAGQSLSLSRVYVLTGPRTCSASELLVNGLKPFVEVVQIGGTTCGKPVGFLPWDNRCGSTVSAVNFEIVNARGEGRYWDGLAPTPRCAIAEDWNHALGDPAEVLTSAALAHVDTGACPAVAAAAADRLGTLSARLREARRLGMAEPGDLHGMIDR